MLQSMRPGSKHEPFRPEDDEHSLGALGWLIVIFAVSLPLALVLL